MSDTSTYNVVSTAEVLSGFDATEVQTSLASLFKISPDKAIAMLERKCIVKKNLDHRTAYQYKKKLESIGLGVALKRTQTQAHVGLSLEPMENEDKNKELIKESDSTSQTPETPPPSLSLALEPMGNDQSNTQENETKTKTIVCPKCHLEQPPTEQCQGCGVFINKVIKQNQINEAPDTNLQKSQSDEIPTKESDVDMVISESAMPTKAWIAAIITAGLGALLWKGIAIGLNLELGLIAWAIGGAIGFAAAMMDSKGENAGIICGALALVAIIGGKYLVMSSLQNDLGDLFSQNLQGDLLVEMYNEELEISKVYYDQVTDEQSLREFMVDYGYTNALDTSNVTSQEISEFEAHTKDRLSSLAIGTMDTEQWKSSFQNAFTSMSPFDLVIGSLDWLDFLFLFLGVGTAFRLGKGSGINARF